MQALFDGGIPEKVYLLPFAAGVAFCPELMYNTANKEADKMKRAFSLIISAAMLAAFAACSPAPAPLTFAADTSGIGEVTAGQEIDVPVRITNNPGFALAVTHITLSAGLEWRVEGVYNPDSDFSHTWPFALNDITIPVRPSAGQVADAMEGSHLRFAFINGGLSAHDFEGDGTLVTLRLRVGDAVTPGQVLSIDIELTYGGAVNMSEERVESAAVPGSVTVAG
jgi:hypothetical protein